MKNTGFKGSVNFFVNFDPIDANNILDNHKHLMKRKKYKIIFVLIKKLVMGLLISIVNGSNYAKSVLLSNQKCMAQPAFINLCPNVCSQIFHYYPFAVKSDRCIGSCNTLNDLFNKVCVPKKYLKLSSLNMITRINELKTFEKHI